MGSVVSIETCLDCTRNHLPRSEIDNAFSSVAELAPIREKIPPLSIETKTIFDRILGKEYADGAPKVNDLRTEFTKFYDKVVLYQNLKYSKPRSPGGFVFIVACTAARDIVKCCVSKKAYALIS